MTSYRKGTKKTLKLVSRTKKTPIRIVGYTEKVDLRKCSAKKTYLDRLAKFYKLKNGEAVCFTNKAQNRFRLVLKLPGMMFMCIPEVDENNKLSIYLRVSEELSRLAALVRTRNKLHTLSDNTRDRINRQNKKRRAALKRKRKKK